MQSLELARLRCATARRFPGISLMRIQNETVLAPNLDLGECRIAQQISADGASFLVGVSLHEAACRGLMLMPKQTEPIFRHGTTYCSSAVLLQVQSISLKSRGAERRGAAARLRRKSLGF